MCDAACYMSQLGSSCARWIGFSTIPTKPPPANVMASTIYLSPSIEWLATTASTTDRFKIANVGSASERARGSRHCWGSTKRNRTQSIDEIVTRNDYNNALAECGDGADDGDSGGGSGAWL